MLDIANIVLSFVGNNPVTSLIATATSMFFVWKIVNLLYIRYAPLKNLSFWLAKILYKLAIKIGIETNKIKDDSLRTLTKEDTKHIGDFLDMFWDAGINGDPMPSLEACWNKKL